MSTQSESAVAFLQMCARGDVADAYSTYVAADFKHHNPWFPADRASLQRGMEESAQQEPNKSFTVKQTIESDNRVMVYSHLVRSEGDMEMAIVHILRFADKRIVEMWDIGQEIPKDSPNQLGMF